MFAGEYSKIDGHADELAVYEQLLAQFGDACDPEIRGCIANALFYRGETLEQNGQPQQALAAYNDVLRRYADSTEPDVREWVEFAAEAKTQLAGKLADAGR